MMTAGRELDALIAEKVFGYRFWLEKRGEYELAVCSIKEPWKSSQQWTWEQGQKRYREVNVNTAVSAGFFGSGPGKYSTDITDAWVVVDEIRKRFRRVEVHALNDGSACCLIEAGTSEADEHYIATADADTAPLAICLAALKAVGVEVRQ